MSREMPTVKQRSSLDGLPKQFVSSLRVLFDILDDEKTGFVKFSEIEMRWRGDGVKGLPPGVVGALQKVTPPNGLLSFERFVAGLKIALLRNKSEKSSREKENEAPETKQTHQNFSKVRALTQSQTAAHPGGHNPNARHGSVAYQPSHLTRSTTTTTATVRPSNFTIAHRANSVPHLAGDSEDGHNHFPRKDDPRHRLVSAGAVPPVKNEITGVLQSWQRNRLGTGAQVLQNKYDPPHSQQGTKSSANLPNHGTEKSETAAYRRTEPKKREPRRHTLGTSGIDYNVIQRMKQLEQEKDLLLQGLEYVEKARDWYHKRIADVRDKQNYLSKSGQMDSVSSEKNQERINFQKARIAEINQQLKILVESSEKGFPSHMNLAIQQRPTRPPKSSDSDGAHLTTMLKAQNRMLTKEVTQKSEKISQLERDKVTLVKQLFEARSSKEGKKTYGDDTTFM